MRDAVRATGSQQLVTVGQDEGGIQDRLSPAYWGRVCRFHDQPFLVAERLRFVGLPAGQAAR